VPVAAVAINGAKNAALLAAQILAVSDPELAARLDADRAGREVKWAARIRSKGRK
jgi:5-(carboxyamino)imidazole ribonucleotide mutase